MFRTDDTIAAISSAAGAGALAIVRLSGPDAIRLAADVFTPAEGSLDGVGFRWFAGFVQLSGDNGNTNGTLASDTNDNGTLAPDTNSNGTLASASGSRQTPRTDDSAIRIPHSAISAELPAVAYVFRGPRSYTRQDVCELHVPGSPAAATWLLQNLLDRGARQAAPGEFTARAFFSGRIDLSAAEGVADIIDAASGAQLRSGLAALGGRIHRFCKDASDSLSETLAAVEASIDLADENIELDSPRELSSRLANLAERLADFAARALDVPEHARELRVAIAGEPNVGKSSLLNALALSQRAIVSDIAGTTRDVLRAEAQIEGQLVLLEDCAGLRDAGDSLWVAGQHAARGAIASADAVIFVVDIARGHLPRQVELLSAVRGMNPRAPLLVLANKMDELQSDSRQQKAVDELSELAGEAAMAISAREGTNLDLLRRRLARILHLEAPRSGDAMGLHLRQKECLRLALEASRRAGELLSAAGSVADVAELAAVELRAAIAPLGLISGEVATEDILGRIFRRFCVGK